jgi:hypothetical protein
MKNRFLAHATITHQHSGGGTMLAGAYVTRQHKCTILVGDIRHPPAQMLPFVLAGALCRPPTLCFAKSTIPFEVVKCCQIKKVVNYKVPYFHNLSIYTIFIRVVASFDKVVVILFTKSISLI